MDLLTATGDIPSGIYRCDIETETVNSADNTARETVYVGVYGSGGIIDTLYYTYNYIRLEYGYFKC